MSSLKAGNIAKGIYLLFKNQPHLVTSCQFVSPGKGSAFTRAKLRSVVTGNTQEFTFKSTETVEQLDVSSKEMQFLYADGEDGVFMDPRTYEQATVPADILGDQLGYLTPDTSVYVLFYNDNAVGITLPKHVKLKVTYTEDSVAGNRVQAPKKPATLETGIEVMVPIFIKVDDLLSIDTETGQYLSRVTQ